MVWSYLSRTALLESLSTWKQSGILGIVTAVLYCTVLCHTILYCTILYSRHSLRDGQRGSEIPTVFYLRE